MTKKLLATSLFAACLATTALASGYALAEDADIYFYPKNKWVITQIDTAAADELKTCALSNQLNNGYIVQIAGNSDGFTNLNIDFRQDSFETNKAYEVKYSVPGIFEDMVPTKAFKKSLLVSDLRGKTEFSDSLRSASVLDVQIRDTSFRMYMTGLDAAMGEYQDCISPPEVLELENPHISLAVNAMEIIEEAPALSNIVPVQLKNIDVAPPPQFDIQIEDVQQSSLQDGGLPQDITTMPEHKLRPTPSSEPRYTQILAQQLKEESEKYKPEIVEEVAQTDEIIEPEASISHVDVELEEKLSSVNVMDVLVEKNMALEDISSVDVASEEELKTVDVAIAMEVDLTKADTAQSFDVADSSQVMDEAAEVLAGIEPTVGNDNAEDFIIMRNKVSELEGQLAELISKNGMLDEELKIILHDAEEERLSVSSSNWNLERATMKFNEAERQIMRLGRKLQIQKSQCQSEKTELENMLFDPELTNQNQLASLALLEEEIDSVKSDLYRQQRQYEERIRLLEKQLEPQ